MISVGKKWSEISRILGNRTENAIKNRWTCLIRKFESADKYFDSNIGHQESNDEDSRKNADS